MPFVGVADAYSVYDVVWDLGCGAVIYDEDVAGYSDGSAYATCYEYV